MTKFAYNLHRAFAWILLVVLILGALNFYLDLGYFGRGAKGVFLLILFVGVIYAMFLAPTRQERRSQKEAKQPSKGD